MSSKSSIALQPTRSGWFVNHYRQDGVSTLYAMGNKNGLADVLWISVEELMRARYGRINITRLGREAHMGGTASRIKAKGTKVGLGVLEKLAAAFGVEPYQLLIADKDLRQSLMTYDKELRRMVTIYSQTDDVGRQTVNTALQIAEQRARNAQAPGMGKAGKAK